MSRYASNQWAYGISDRSGFRYRLKDMRKEWTGMLVGKDEWEPKHPQLQPIRTRPDPKALRDPRPDSDAGHVYVSIGDNIFPTPKTKATQAIGSVGRVTVTVS